MIDILEYSLNKKKILPTYIFTFFIRAAQNNIKREG